ncbi:MAG: Integrase core domain protein [Verrucomicrobia bacterium ADurb.Bin474]|nr:MAG: Integrase core domain protein [Verrucomicrobia bacterium ADurb.Bin474]
MTVLRQCELLGINRSGVYRKRGFRVLDDEELEIRMRIDRIHTDEPTWGHRTITTILRLDYGILINRKRTRRIMQEMGIYTLFPKPNLSKRYHSQFLKPYLLRHVTIERVHQVWGIDITYIHMPKGFMYLFVILDWHSRYVVDFELSSTLDKSFVLVCLKRALSRHKPEIINSDQGGHFTNPDYCQLVESFGVRISMDGKGQCLDNARTERFFRTLKYDRIYLNEIETPRELRAILREYMFHYNHHRPHSSIDNQTPASLFHRQPLIHVG